MGETEESVRRVCVCEIGVESWGGGGGEKV